MKSKLKQSLRTIGIIFFLIGIFVIASSFLIQNTVFVDKPSGYTYGDTMNIGHFTSLKAVDSNKALCEKTRLVIEFKAPNGNKKIFLDTETFLTKMNYGGIKPDMTIKVTKDNFPQAGTYTAIAYCRCEDVLKKNQLIGSYSNPVSIKINELVCKSPCTKDSCKSTRLLKCVLGTDGCYSLKDVGISKQCGAKCEWDKDCPENYYCQIGKCAKICYKEASIDCSDNNMYYYDSCGARGELFGKCKSNQYCERGECKDNEESKDYTQLYEKKCIKNDVYWFDSDGVAINFDAKCTEEQQCLNGECVDIEQPTCLSYPSKPCDEAVKLSYPTCNWDSTNCITEPPKDNVEIPSESLTDTVVINPPPTTTEDKEPNKTALIIGGIISFVGALLLAMTWGKKS